MTPEALLEAARRLIADGVGTTEGLWSRAAVTLIRQAIEKQVADLLAERAPGAQAAPMRSQLLCLEKVHGDQGRARQLAYTWYRLSEVLHQQAYELPPTAEEVRNWLTAADPQRI
jgi:hypothetical protein